MDIDISYSAKREIKTRDEMLTYISAWLSDASYRTILSAYTFIAALCGKNK